MKVLLVNGSPHQFGCTYTALCEVEESLKGEGINTELIHIGTKPIPGCIACGKCKKNTDNLCMFDDLVNEIKVKTKAADGFVFGSPVHYASASGGITSFLDRLFYSSSSFAYKVGATVVSARRAGTTAALDQLNKYLTISNMMLVGSQYWNMVHGNSPDEVRQDEEGLQTMRSLGRNMAWLLRSIESGRHAGIPTPSPEPKLRTNFIR